MVIAIGGVSRSGKSTLASRIKHRLGNDQCQIIEQDRFVHSLDKIPVIHGKLDWEHPDSIDFEKLKQAIVKAANSKKYTIVEGLLAFHWPELNELFDLNIFLKITKEEFIRRKEEDERWGMEPDWYIEHIWDSYEKYGIIDLRSAAYIIFDGSVEITEEDLDEILR